MILNEKQKFIKNNFEYHARIAAHAFSVKHGWDERRMDVVYQACMSFMDSAFESGKIEVKEVSEWDHQEKEYQTSIRDEAIRRGDWDGIKN